MAELELRGCGDGGQKRREKGVRTSAAIGTVWVSKVGVELMDTFLDFSVLFLTEDRALHPLMIPKYNTLMTHCKQSGL